MPSLSSMAEANRPEGKSMFKDSIGMAFLLSTPWVHPSIVLKEGYPLTLTLTRAPILPRALTSQPNMGEV